MKLKTILPALLVALLLAGIVAIFVAAFERDKELRIDDRAAAIIRHVANNYMGGTKGEVLELVPGATITHDWQGVGDPAVLVRLVAEKLPKTWAELTDEQHEDVRREIVLFIQAASRECWNDSLTRPLWGKEKPEIVREDNKLYGERPIRRLDEDKLRDLARDAARRLTAIWSEDSN